MSKKSTRPKLFWALAKPFQTSDIQETSFKTDTMDANVKLSKRSSTGSISSFKVVTPMRQFDQNRSSPDKTELSSPRSFTYTGLSRESPTRSSRTQTNANNSTSSTRSPSPSIRVSNKISRSPSPIKINMTENATPKRSSQKVVHSPIKKFNNSEAGIPDRNEISAEDQIISSLKFDLEYCKKHISKLEKENSDIQISLNAEISRNKQLENMLSDQIQENNSLNNRMASLSIDPQKDSNQSKSSLALLTLK